MVVFAYILEQCMFTTCCLCTLFAGMYILYIHIHTARYFLSADCIATHCFLFCGMDCVCGWLWRIRRKVSIIINMFYFVRHMYFSLHPISAVVTCMSIVHG